MVFSERPVDIDPGSYLWRLQPLVSQLVYYWPGGAHWDIGCWRALKSDMNWNIEIFGGPNNNNIYFFPNMEFAIWKGFSSVHQ